MKKTTASRTFILMAFTLMAVVLFLPWGNSGLAAAPAKCCPHCGAGVSGISSGPCCPKDMPGHCGGSGQNGAFGCRCANASPAFITLPVAVSPTWHVSTYLPVGVTLAAALFPPNIFHPPEASHLPAIT